MRLFKINFFHFVFVCFVAGFCCIFTGCSQKERNSEEDIITQKKEDADKQQITVLVKYAFTINTFEKAVEDKFPNVDIVQVGNFTSDMGIAEYESRLKNDDIPDIVMTWPLDVGEEYWEDRLLDLSGFNFTNNYNLSMLNTISKEGKLYYLPGPSQVRGIIYNKTLFEENGWQVPKDYEGFVELCQTIENSGIRALQLGLANGEVLDTAFVGYGYADCYSQPQDTQWIQEYNQGKNSFGDHFGPALDTFQNLIDEGILQEGDLDISYAEREKMLYNRECAMVEDAVLLARMAKEETGGTQEFGLMPFFNPGDGGDWARIYMVCFIGMNKHLAEPENKVKYNQVVEIMEYISTPEGQEALMGDTGAMFSSLIGIEPSDAPEIEHLVPALESGRYCIFPTLENAQEALRKGLAGMIKGTMTKEEVIEMVDEQNANPIEKMQPLSLGSAEESFSLTETGNFIADCMREKSNCDIALFLDNGKDGRYNGKGVSGRLYQGDITVQDIKRILPDMKEGEKGTLWKVSMTGEDLLKTLEHSITISNNQGGWFYYFSGLRMEFDPTAEAGNRIKKITMEDGTALDKEQIYSIAIMDQTVPEEFFQSCEKTSLKISDILQGTIAKKRTIKPSKDGRFIVTHT